MRWGILYYNKIQAMENIEYIFNWAIYFCFFTIVYGLFIIISTRIDIKNIRSEYLIDSVIQEINKQNSVAIKEAESSIKATSMIYIDNSINRINNNLDGRIKRLMKEKV